MSRRRPVSAGREALALYAREPLGVRVHVHGRWWSAPFAPAAAALPPTGRILEIGCGHGLFAAYCALSEPGRTVVGVDIDAAKIRHAQAAAIEGRLSFAVGASGEVPAGPWDAVAIVDMLYLLPASEQRRLLAAAARTLAPGGILVIKEMGTRPRWKVRWNTWQETVSVRVLRITAGSSLEFVPPAVMAGWLGELGLTTTARRLDRGRMHPHHLLVARR
ncbi:class I SAM-dependent methyltransferase [Pengzhenrongella sicca]|uniref:Class I SAM-dependent methyltransferase n=1 Tax=Pengzhenrongella sicca TaxID=2819238 RepID=A0A8A4ZH36_9MICO|nr:class I SAM-dependent methyltransferase [Pengzhenrongella sicca]QTE30273.1 class I SAM-dependent methyltransferase [Pengzhenrongella sicca]